MNNNGTGKEEVIQEKNLGEDTMEFGFKSFINLSAADDENRVKGIEHFLSSLTSQMKDMNILMVVDDIKKAEEEFDIEKDLIFKVEDVGEYIYNGSRLIIVSDISFANELEINRLDIFVCNFSTSKMVIDDIREMHDVFEPVTIHAFKISDEYISNKLNVLKENDKPSIFRDGDINIVAEDTFRIL